MIVSIIIGPHLIAQGEPQAAQDGFVKVGDTWGRLCNGTAYADVVTYLDTQQ